MSGSLATYQPRRNCEQILQRNSVEKYVDIETQEDCLFWFRQRALQYGSSITILDPPWFAQEICDELKKASQNYMNR
jgi:predicted DNA-binding transcriptional regulator YafY